MKSLRLELAARPRPYVGAPGMGGGLNDAVFARLSVACAQMVAAFHGARGHGAHAELPGDRSPQFHAERGPYNGGGLACVHAAGVSSRHQRADEHARWHSAHAEHARRANPGASVGPHGAAHARPAAAADGRPVPGGRRPPGHSGRRHDPRAQAARGAPLHRVHRAPTGSR